MLLGILGFFGGLKEVAGIPYFARSTGMSCLDCHSVAPKLNARGESFLARGYRMPQERDLEGFVVPVSVWSTARYEEQPDAGQRKAYVPKVELVSGGPIGDLPLSYFLEWRVVSLDMRADGTLRDRGGRFEDAFMVWQMADRHELTVGQYRSLQQYDVSLRLSVSEPAIFSTSLAGEWTDDARIRGLRAFSPAMRSPGIAYTYQSLEGPRASDGLFHHINLPFVGEWSIPLSDEARREASFEFKPDLKGVFLETFYRRELNSVGAHLFIDRDRWLATAVGRGRYNDFYGTAGIGMDDARGRSSRMRYSLEAEYLPQWGRLVRPGAGFRIEHVTNTGREPAYIPYLVVSGPNTVWSFLLQIQYRWQRGNDGLFVDLSAIF